MLSKPLLTIFSPTKAPAMMTPTYTDVFDCFVMINSSRERVMILNVREEKNGKKWKDEEEKVAKSNSSVRKDHDHK